MSQGMKEESITAAEGSLKGSKLNRVIEVLWAGALVLLPITSAPYLTKLTGTLVAPPAMILIGLLLILSLLPLIRRRRTLPLETVPLIFFVLFALVSTALSFFIDIPTLKDGSLWRQALEGFITLGMGISFFLVAANVPASEEDFKKALRWITIGGMIMTAFTLLQAFFLFIQKSNFAAWYIWVEETLVTPRPFSRYLQRLYGMAFEPSWFTHQLVMLYFPIWISATFQRISVFKFRLLRLTAENILLMVNLAFFLLAKPRVSLLALLLIFTFVFFKLSSLVFHGFQKRLQVRFSPKTIRAGRVINGLVITGMLLAFAVGVLGIILFFQQDPRMEAFFTDPITLKEFGLLLKLDEDTLLGLSSRFEFMERVVYWISGWRVFNDYPILGVGLGNSGFFFLDNCPSIGWTSTEVRYLLNSSPYLPNVKSLWVRLLAETGLVGFSIFIAWLMTLWRTTFHTLQSRLPFHRLVAFMSQLMLVALIAEGFSIDSFALPYLWVVAGLAAAAGASHRKNLLQGLSPEEPGR